jgi:aryl-alcohol dehydrogenase-like predicted oxidoreductase
VHFHFLSCTHQAEILFPINSSELDCKVAHLALAWVARNPNTGTVILGASRPEQVIDNLKALDVIPKLTPDVLEKIETILGNKPAGPVS